MAKALVSCDWEDAAPGTPAGRVTIVVKAIYVGTDLPGGILLDHDIITVENLDLSIQPAQIVSAIASAVRTRATSLGVTVGTNEIILPDLVKG